MQAVTDVLSMYLECKDESSLTILSVNGVTMIDGFLGANFLLPKLWFVFNHLCLMSKNDSKYDGICGHALAIGLSKKKKLGKPFTFYII